MRTEPGGIAIVGATGVVGREALRVLEGWGIARDRVLALASGRSAGARIAYAGSTLRVRAWDAEAVSSASVVVLCVSAGVSRRVVEALRGSDARIVDASSAFRMREGTALVIPEVNPGALSGSARLVSSPNCSTILLLTALEPLRRAFGVREITVSTYQAVSGAGRAGLEELRAQTRYAARGGGARPGVFPEPIAFNCFCHESAVDPETGLNGEERKIIEETRKIWSDPGVRVNPTCVRVPVERAHSESVSVRLGRPATPGEVGRALTAGAGLRVVGGEAGGRFPTPLEATGCDEVLVGRVRRSPGARIGDRGECDSYTLWLCGDQLRKGAALNALQIARALCPGALAGDGGGERGPAGVSAWRAEATG